MNAARQAIGNELASIAEILASRKHADGREVTLLDRTVAASELPPNDWPVHVLDLTAVSRTIFGPLKTVTPRSFEEEGFSLIDALVWCELSPSRGQAKTAIASGAVRINGEQCRDIGRKLAPEDFAIHGAAVLENGRRNYFPIFLES